MKHRRFLDNEGTMQARRGYEASVKKLLSAEPRNVPSKGNRWKGRFLLIQLLASVSHATNEATRPVSHATSESRDQ